MVIYLPLSFLKDFIYKLMRGHSGSSSASKIACKSSFGGSAPLKNGEFQKMLEMESQKTILINYSDVEIPIIQEVKPLICGITEINDAVSKKQELSAKEIATYGLYLCPLWFVTEVNFCGFAFYSVRRHQRCTLTTTGMFFFPELIGKCYSFSLTLNGCSIYQMLRLQELVLPVQLYCLQLQDSSLFSSVYYWAKIP